jgi:hypothetical protein
VWPSAVTFVSSRTTCPLASVITVIIEVRRIDHRLKSEYALLDHAGSIQENLLTDCTSCQFSETKSRLRVEATLMAFDGGQGATSIDRSEEQPFLSKDPHTTSSEVEVCNNTAHIYFANQKSLGVPDVDSVIYTVKMLGQQIV